MSPSEVVTTFLALWERPGGLDRSFRDYFNADTVWENHGLVTTTGPDEAIALNAAQREHGSGDNPGGKSRDGRDGQQGADRADRLHPGRRGRDADGRAGVGIFEVDGGRIVAWRDYFDTIANAPPAD